jgi:hypothetical protein
MSWTPPLHKLLSPITSDKGEQITEIQLRPLFYATHREALEEAGDDEEDQYFALASLATGLSEAELDQLKRPDYVTVSQYVHEQSRLPSSYFLADEEPAKKRRTSRVVAISSKKKDEDQNVVKLLMPIMVMGRSVESLTLEMPALKATKAMKKLATPAERSEFITAHCTGLMLPDLAFLTVPDWTQLQGRIDDFLNKPAAFFRKATSK